MKLLRGAAIALIAMTAAVQAAAQIPGTEITQVLASRPTLESLLTRYEEAANQTSTYSAPVRADARRKAAMVRARLADGDFHVGDRVLLDIAGESLLSDTFTVQPGRQLILPTVGPVPLEGVLRFELTDFLTGRLSRFLRDPKIRARSLIRVMIAGGVVKQGFYTVPVDVPVDAVIQQAGGFGPFADMEKISVERGTEVLFMGVTLQNLIAQGTTIDALGIQAGDKFKVGVTPPSNTNPVQRVQALQYLLALPFSVLALGKLFGF